MPISPEFVTQLAGAVLSLAGGTEVAVAQAVAGRVGRDVGADALGPKVESIRLLQAELLRIAHKFTSDVSPELRVAIERGAFEGRAQAKADVIKALGHLRGQIPNLDALINLAAELVAPVTDPAIVGAGILRAGTDAYRVAVARATSGVLLGAQTRREAAQQALDLWARRGVAAFRDARGRTWDLATYAEMSTRTAAQRAMTQAHTETLLADDVRLVIVSNAPQECERCRPWEGKVLAIGFQRGTSFPPLADAERAGLFHPNCRHSIGAYIPGVTKPHAGPTADPEGDAARQELRRLERQVRAAKRLEAVALDEQAAKAARAKVRSGQAAIRAHLETPAGSRLARQPARERIGSAR